MKTTAILAMLFSIFGPNAPAQYVNEELAAIYGMSAATYADIGTTNNYDLVRLNNLENPSGFVDGMTILFTASASNTGVSTINVAGLGTRYLVDHLGNHLQKRAVLENELVWATYDAANDVFVCHGAFKGPLNVKWFGAKGNNTTDDTAAIQSAIDTGGSDCVIYFPPGLYRLEDQLTVTENHVSLIGGGARSSVLRVYHDNGTALTVEHPTDPGSSYYTAFEMRNMGLRAAVETTSGSLVELNHIQDVFFESVSLENHFGGLVIKGGLKHYYNGLQILSCTPSLWGEGKSGSFFLKATSSAAGDEPTAIFLGTFNFRRNDSVNTVENGIVIEAADGIMFDHGHIMGVSNAEVLIDPYDGTEQLTGVSFDDVWFDNNATYGLAVVTNSTAIYGRILISNCKFSSHFTGILVDSSAVDFGGISMTGGAFQRSGKYGALLGAGYSHIFSGVSFEATDMDGYLNAGAVTLKEGADNVQITGCLFTKKCLYNVSTTMKGLRINSGNSSNIFMTGNSFDLVADDISDTSTSDHNRYINNITTKTLRATATGGVSALLIPESGEYITVDDGLDFGNMTGRWFGRVVTLRFLGSSTVSHVSNQMELAGRTSFSASAGDTLTLIYDETNTAWRELSRTN